MAFGKRRRGQSALLASSCRSGSGARSRRGAGNWGRVERGSAANYSSARGASRRGAHASAASPTPRSRSRHRLTQRRRGLLGASTPPSYGAKGKSSGTARAAAGNIERVRGTTVGCTVGYEKLTSWSSSAFEHCEGCTGRDRSISAHWRALQIERSLPVQPPDRRRYALRGGARPKASSRHERRFQTV